MKDIQSLSHSKWRCQYHIVFAPQYRRNIWANKRRHREDTEETVRAKRCGNHRGLSMPRPYSHAGKYSAESQCGTIHGLSQREEQFNDI